MGRQVTQVPEKTVEGRGSGEFEIPEGGGREGTASKPRWLERLIKKKKSRDIQRTEGQITRHLQVLVRDVLWVLFYV